MMQVIEGKQEINGLSIFAKRCGRCTVDDVLVRFFYNLIIMFLFI